MNLDPAYISSRLLTAGEGLGSGRGKPGQAAVLVLLCAGPSPLTILTRRSESLPTHAGQISFPGGRVHADDASLEATALREAREETGLDPGQVQVLGRLPPATVVSSGVEITPVVGWTATRPRLQADPREVVEVIECPLARVLDPTAYGLDHLIRDNIKKEFYFIEFNEYYVWGATARILRSLALALGRDLG